MAENGKKPKKKRYEPLAVRLKKAQQAEDAKKVREAEKQAKAEKKAERETVKAAKADAESGSLGAALSRFIEHHGPDADKIGDGEAAVVADFLRPYVDRLKKLERNLPEFPAQSDLPWWDVESAVLDVNEPRTINKIGESFGLDRHRIYEMSKKRKWKERRAVLQELQARKSTMAALAQPTQIITGNGKSLSKDSKEDAEEKKFVSLVEDCISVFNEALKNGMIRMTSTRDLDTLMRLLHFLKGKAEKIEERRHRVTPDQFKEIVAEVAKQVRWSPAAAGVVLDADYEIVGDLDEMPGISDAEFETVEAPR